jgi:hypothetical protein
MRDRRVILPAAAPRRMVWALVAVVAAEAQVLVGEDEELGHVQEARALDPANGVVDCAARQVCTVQGPFAAACSLDALQVIGGGSAPWQLLVETGRLDSGMSPRSMIWATQRTTGMGADMTVTAFE